MDQFTDQLQPGKRFGKASEKRCVLSPADWLNALTSDEGYEVCTSIPYGSDARQTLDVYSPADAASAPVVVFFYGGSWQTGSKESYLFAAAALAKRGHVVIVPDYRLYPEVRYPAFLDDGALAVQWVKRNVRTYGGDPGRLFVMGHSAGAYIAAMLAIDDRWLTHAGLSPQADIAGLIGLSGPYDFLPLKDRTLKTIFGGTERRETQPISHVSGAEPPALLMTGQLDRTVHPGNSKRLAARLRHVGGTIQLLTFWNLGHLETIGSLAPVLRFFAPTLRHIDDFIAAKGRRSHSQDAAA